MVIDHVRGAYDFVGPRLGVFGADVDVAFGHRGDGGRVDLFAGFGATGPGDRVVAGVVLEEAERHLGAAGVVDAQEQHDGLAVDLQPFDPGQGLETLPGEAFGQQGRKLAMVARPANWS